MNNIELLKKINNLKKNDKLSRSEIIELQEKKLKKLISYVYNNSHYYKKELESIGFNGNNILSFALDDLKKIKFIEKEKYIENYNDILTVRDISLNDVKKYDENDSDYRDLYLNKYHVIHTSGTENDPFYILYDEESWNDVLSGITRIALFDMKPKEMIEYLLKGIKIANIMSCDGRYAGHMSITDSICKLGVSYKNIDICEKLDDIENEINIYNPNVIIGYASMIVHIAMLCEKKKINIKPNRVITCGEPLTPEERKYIEKVFGIRVINCYGASESIPIGIEYDINDGMLLFDDLNIIEVENDCIYLTNLYNFTCPFIRYKLNDKIKLKDTSEKDKYPYQKADTILGRHSDILWLNDKKEFIHPLMIEGFTSEGVIDFQIIKINEMRFDINIIMDDSRKDKKLLFDKVKEKIENYINELLSKKGLIDVIYKINEVENIIIDPISKKKKIVLNCNGAY